MCLLSAAAAASAQPLTALTATIPAPVSITQIVSCNPAVRDFETAQLAATLDDAVADHHRPVPITAVDRTGPLEDSPPAQRPAATDVLPAAAANLAIVSSVPVTSVAGLTSIVGEPSAAVRGQEILFTGNWYAAFSRDGGLTFDCVDSSKTFPRSPHDQEFCCDQVVMYSREHDVMIWLLQYSRWAGQRPNQSSTENIHRLAVAAGDDIRAQRWRFYDLRPAVIGASSNEWFDYPDLAVSNDFLYLTTNAFETGGNTRFTRSIVARMPLRQLRNYEPVQVEFVAPPDAGTLKLARGAASTMYFATHVRAGSAQYVRAYSWPDATNAIQFDDVLVQRWNPGASAAPGPDGNDWLGRRDGRITAAWFVNNRLGFAWTAGHGAPFRFPHVRVAIVDPATMVSVAQPHVWNDAYAFAYPAAAPNRDGSVGLVVAFGGNRWHPSLSVGYLQSGAAGLTWRLARAVLGTDGPGGDDEGKWGDYLALLAHPTQSNVWMAAGYTLQGGRTGSNVEPRYLTFRTGAERSLTDEEAAQRVVRESVRLEATWQQQPNNALALQRAMERLSQAIGAANAAAPEDPVAPPPSDKGKMIDDTHRPTPNDAGVEATRLSDAEMKRILAAAAATLNMLERSLQQGRKDLNLEKKAIAGLSETLKTIK
jgi:hypothetical protein